MWKRHDWHKIWTNKILSTNVPNLRCKKGRNLFQVKNLQTRETSPLEETEITLPIEKGEATFYRKSACPGSDWSISMQMRNPNHTVLIGPNITVLIGQNQVFWLASIDTDEDMVAQFWLEGAGLSPLVERRFRELLYKGRMTEIQCRRLGSSVCDFSLRCSTCERPPSAMAASLWLLIWAHLTTRSPSWQIYSFSGCTILIFSFPLKLLFPRSRLT